MNRTYKLNIDEKIKKKPKKKKKNKFGLAKKQWQRCIFHLTVQLFITFLSKIY